MLNSKRERITDKNAFLKTTKLLDINPEFNAVWNYRREIIKTLSLQLDENFWDSELNFTMEKLKVRPKVYWIWNHRLWCLQSYPNSPLKIWLKELAIVSKLLEMDSRNFHGWHYRRFIVKTVESLSGRSLNSDEFEYTTKKINQNISNFSAWFQRTTIIESMLSKDQISDMDSFINNEFEYIKNAIFTDAEDQSVWTYLIWFIKESAMKNIMEPELYSNMVKALIENIVLINDDELSFSGKDNGWCLKTLIVLESIQKEYLKEDIQSKSQEYLDKLITIDPLRKNRYLHQLKNL